mmetsp:Transcript_539/g.1264  ORF Transcript_539/g.1264 Transcript_539/m.1264 type:complete len:663 (-) Transcript_539:275-2263(-)
MNMSGSNHAHYNPEYIGAATTTRENEYNAYASTPAPTALHNHGIQATANALAPLRTVVPTLPPTTMQPQQHQPQSQPQSLLYDISSFDPLQAQALQLTASAGLTTADILAAAAAPGIASAATPAETNSSVAIGVTAATAPAGIASGIPHPVTSYSQSLAQQQAQSPIHGAPTSIAAAPVSISGGQLQPIQPVPAPATATHHPYIFIQPQQFAPSATPAPTPATTTYFGSPATTASNPLLVPAPAAGVPAASTQAQATAVAAAAAAGLGAHPFLLNPALFTAAAAHGIPGLTTTAGRPGQHVLQHATQPATQKPAHHAHVAATANALAPALILPSMNPHQALSQQHSKKRPLGSGVVMNEIAPSVVSSATAPVTEANKRQRGQSKKVNNVDEANLGDPAEKRRYERNLREQQRSSKISSQIKELREVLSECNVPFKPNKYSILLKVVEYIKQLQSRAIMLDAEHQKLITTVRQTNEMITSAANNNGMSSTTCGATDNESSDTTQEAWQQGDRVRRGGRGDSDLCFVKGIDYRNVFEQCPTAFGIAALDGRILECNVEFQNLLGYTVREELLKQSLFNLVHNHQDIFRAMAQMLKTAEEPTPKNNNTNAASGAPNGANDNTLDRFWTGPVTSKQNVKLSMNITLTSGDNGTPKFFSCALTNSVV